MCLFMVIFCMYHRLCPVGWGFPASDVIQLSRYFSLSVSYRLGYPSFTVEKHQHSNPGKAASEAGSDIYSKKSHRRIGYLVAWTNAEITKMGACC